MNTTRVIVSLIGFVTIALIIWYFWLWKREEIVAPVGTDGIQVVEVTVRGGYQPDAIVVKSRAAFTPKFHAPRNIIVR